MFAARKLWFFVCAGVFLIFLFLPWTQNIRAKGTVTTLYQDQRPQQVNTIIGGRIMKWHIKEGDYVKAGDTLVQLTEVKADYLDPNLLQRTQQQLAGKQQSVEYYKSKVGVADQQVGRAEVGAVRRERAAVGGEPALEGPQEAIQLAANRAVQAACDGFGARGLVFASICAELLASQVDGEPLPLERDLVRAIAPTRFRQSVKRPDRSDM